MSPSLSIIVVNYHSETDLQRCIESLARFEPALSYELIVVDNGSTGDRLKRVLGQIEPSTEIKMISSDQNVGFARACNRGLSMARSEYLFLLNPDTVFVENSVSRMIDFLRQNSRVGAVGCQQITASGELRIGRAGYHPGLRTAFNHSFFLSRLFPKIFKGIYLIHDKTERPVEVDWVCGGSLIVRQEVVRQVGGMDDSFFLYSEDIEWCSRMRKRGWKIYYLPSTRMIHDHKRDSLRDADPGTGLKSQIALYRKDHRNASGKIFFLTVSSGLILRSALYFLSYLFLKRSRDKEQGKKLFHSVFGYFR